MGLDQEEPARAAPPPASRAKTPPPAAADEDEKTTAFSLDDVRRAAAAQRPAPGAFVGQHQPMSRPGAAVRGGAVPSKRSETLALAPTAARAMVQAHQQEQAHRPEAESFDDEKTSALSLDDLQSFDAMRAKRAASAPVKPAPAARGRPAPAAKIPLQLEESERTMAVPLEDAIAQIEARPAKKPAVVAAVIAKTARQVAAPVADEDEGGDEGEKTTAMSLDDLQALEVVAPRRPARMPAKVAPPKAAPVAAKESAIDFAAGEGFIGAIGYAFKHDAIAAQVESGKIGAVKRDADRKSAGLRNLIIVGGAVAVLMLVFGIIW